MKEKLVEELKREIKRTGINTLAIIRELLAFHVAIQKLLQKKMKLGILWLRLEGLIQLQVRNYLLVDAASGNNCS